MPDVPSLAIPHRFRSRWVHEFLPLMNRLTHGPTPVREESNRVSENEPDSRLSGFAESVFRSRLGFYGCAAITAQSHRCYIRYEAHGLPDLPQPADLQTRLYAEESSNCRWASHADRITPLDEPLAQGSATEHRQIPATETVASGSVELLCSLFVPELIFTAVAESTTVPVHATGNAGRSLAV